MKDKGILMVKQSDIEQLLERYLRLRRVSGGNDFTNKGNHLDEDSLAAFVEGNLARRQAGSIVAHLADCSFCRHNTAELVKLDFALAGEILPSAAETDSAPASVSDVLHKLFSRIFGSADDAVFAHQDGEEEKSEEEKIAAEEK